MRSAEFFTGAGGLALGLHLAAFRHELLVESDKEACTTLRLNVEHEAFEGVGHWNVVEDRVQDVQDYLDELVGLDLAAAGVPCQPFSNGGKRTGHDDDRSMFPTFSWLVAVIRPRAFLLENVDALARADSDGFEYVRLQLTYPSCAPDREEHWRDHLKKLRALAEGLRPEYTVHWRVLNAADYGVPQRRKRVFFVGFRSDIGLTWDFPEPTHSHDALVDDQWVSGDYWRRHGVTRVARVKPHPATIARVERHGPGEMLPWTTVREAIADLSPPSGHRPNSGVTQHLRIPGARPYPGHTGSPPDLPAKSLKAGVHGVPGGENMLVNGNGSVRYFTIRECARIQTFPDTWTFEGRWSRVTRQIGNAVPVELARVVAVTIFNALVDWDRSEVDSARGSATLAAVDRASQVPAGRL